MIKLTDANITKKILEKPKAIVDFWAPWCNPCLQFAPLFEKVSSESTDIAFGKVNIEEYRDLALEFNVMSIPTVLFFKDGKEVGRFTGSIPIQAFKDKIKEFLG